MNGWMCVVEGKRGPLMVHETLEIARGEAERLRDTHPGHRTWVLAIIEEFAAIPKLAPSGRPILTVKKS